MTALYFITILIFLLALPVALLFMPHFSVGLMEDSFKRRLEGLLSKAIFPESSSIVQNNLKNDIIGKLSKIERRQIFTTSLTLQKKLKYAQWRISRRLFYTIEVTSALLGYFIFAPFLTSLLKYFAFFVGPVILHGLLNRSVEKRFQLFDVDFPEFLLSIVGLLKTGMAPVNAMETAAQSLDTHSLVRLEAIRMIERMRLGAVEERSIGSFGETIHHPEIELFIQALLLSKQVGGGLSDTLERLAKQVQKRQYFRNSAHAAVALQKGSVWVILGVLLSVQLYIYQIYPILIMSAWYNPTGQTVWQGAILLVLLAVLWSNEITKIKI